MRKIRSNQPGGLGIIATAFLVCSLAAFGCSTNRMPGDGQPSMGPANASPAATPGTSSGTSNPPMASASAIGMEIDRATDAAAIMAAHQRIRVLGPIGAEGPQQTPPEQMHTGQLIPPSLTANPESTINASISSDANAYVTGGDIGATSVALPATVAGTTASTPTTAAATVPAPTAAAATLTPTMSSVVIPSPNSSANTIRTLRVTPASTTTTTAASTTTASTLTTASGRVVVPIRVMSAANGGVTVTNVAASAPVVIKGK